MGKSGKDDWNTKDKDYQAGKKQGGTERKTTDKLNKEADKK